MDTLPALIPQIQRRLERLESRVKLLEDENRGGIDITKFYTGKAPPPPDDVIRLALHEMVCPHARYPTDDRRIESNNDQPNRGS